MSSERHGDPATYGAAARTSYLVGAAARWAVDLVGAPYRALAGRRANRRPGEARYDQAGPRRRISRGLTQMLERLHEIEQRFVGGNVGDSVGALAGEIEALHRVTTRPGKVTDHHGGPEPGEVRFALTNLDSIPTDERTALILETLQDPSVELRCLAARAAARGGSTATVFSLILALSDPVVEVRRAVKNAIESITGADIDFDTEHGGPARGAELERLKSWWKAERFARLTTELESALKP